MSTFDACTPTSDSGMSVLERRLLMACNSGGSGRGMSFWATAAHCGRRAVRGEERAQRLRLLEAPPPDAKVYFNVGSVYHKLHELWRSEPDALVFEHFVDPNVAEGMRLFEGWRSAWPVDLWGEVLAAEVTTPVASRDAVLHAFDGNVVNSKPDMVTWMDDEACRRAEMRGLYGLEPGAYIIDWKTTGAIKQSPEQFTQGLQAVWYPTAWNLEFPGQPVRGMIFDLVSKKHKSFGANAFAAHYAPAMPVDEGLARIRGMVLQGARNIAAGQCNIGASRDWLGSTCPYLGREGGCG